MATVTRPLLEVPDRRQFVSLSDSCICQFFHFDDGQQNENNERRQCCFPVPPSSHGPFPSPLPTPFSIPLLPAFVGCHALKTVRLQRQKCKFNADADDASSFCLEHCHCCNCNCNCNCNCSCSCSCNCSC